VLVVADVVGDLTVQGGLEDPLGQLLQQTTLTGQLQPVTTSPIDQHRDQLLIHGPGHRPSGRLLLNGGLGRHRGVSPFDRPISRYLCSPGRGCGALRC
jgi:hypothetical protein